MNLTYPSSRYRSSPVYKCLVFRDFTVLIKLSQKYTFSYVAYIVSFAYEFLTDLHCNTINLVIYLVQMCNSQAIFSRSTMTDTFIHTYRQRRFTCITLYYTYSLQPPNVIWENPAYGAATLFSQISLFHMFIYIYMYCF